MVVCFIIKIPIQPASPTRLWTSIGGGGGVGGVGGASGRRRGWNIDCVDRADNLFNKNKIETATCKYIYIYIVNMKLQIFITNISSRHVIASTNITWRGQSRVNAPVTKVNRTLWRDQMFLNCHNTIRNILQFYYCFLNCSFEIWNNILIREIPE